MKVVEAKPPRKSRLADMMRQQGYLSVREASTRGGHAVSTVYRWLEEGVVDGCTVGRARYIKLDSLARYLGPEGAKLLKDVK